MEMLRNLIIRLRHTGVLLVFGILLIVYLGFGFVYWQQGGQQKEYQEQIVKLGAVVARPLAGIDELRAEYEEVQDALAPLTDQAAIELIVSIAEKSGIDIDENSGKLRIPSVASRQVNMAGATYQVLSFVGIRVQADRDNVMAFLSDLDSGETLKTMVLTSVATSQMRVMFTGEEAARRAEFRQVASAVKAMMADIGLLAIPEPIGFSAGVATNLMGDAPETDELVEGFPDITTTAVDKGYTGTDSPRDGYVLYSHAKILTDDTTQFVTVSYVDMLTTTYYYTCEADGTVRQFDGANLAMATEYLGSEEYTVETAVTVSVDIYTRLRE